MKTATPRIPYNIVVGDSHLGQFREVMGLIHESRTNPRTGKWGAMVINWHRQTVFSNVFRINLTDDELLVAKLKLPHLFKPMDEIAKELNDIRS